MSTMVRPDPTQSQGGQTHGFDGLADIDHLLKQLCLLFMPPRGIHDDDIEPFLFKLGHPQSRDGHGVGLCITPVKGDLGLGRVLFQLVERSCSEGVGADETGSEAFSLVVHGELWRSSRAAGQYGAGSVGLRISNVGDGGTREDG